MVPDHQFKVERYGILSSRTLWYRIMNQKRDIILLLPELIHFIGANVTLGAKTILKHRHIVCMV